MSVGAGREVRSEVALYLPPVYWSGELRRQYCCVLAGAVNIIALDRQTDGREQGGIGQP